MNKDQKLIAEAYQKVLEQDYARFSGSDKLQAITPDNVEYVNTPEPYDPRASKRREQIEKDQKRNKEILTNRWLDIGDIKYIADFIKNNIEREGHNFKIYNVKDLKPGDKNSQDFIMTLAKKDLKGVYLGNYGQPNNRKINPNEILKKYREYIDPILQKHDDEKEAQEDANILKRKSTYNNDAHNDTVEKLKKLGFKSEKMKRNEQDVLVRPMSKAIGGFLSGQSKEKVVVNINPDGSLNNGIDYDTWYNSQGRRVGNTKRSWF